MDQVVLTRDQVRRIDELAITKYRIPGIILMENAGRNAAELIRTSFDNPSGVTILCGMGNNGGDGCVIARHLHNAGCRVRVLIAGDVARLTSDARGNFDIVRAMGLDICIATDADEQQSFVNATLPDDIVVDALLGTGFRGEVREPTASLICAVNELARRAIVAVDVPSGLDCDTGAPSASTIKADLTITFVAIKRGFLEDVAKEYLGRVVVADIGAPSALMAQVATGSA